jgi:outer membrane protein
MKKNIFAILIACFISTASVLNAQNVKIGHVNSQEIISLLPEVKSAEANLQKFQQQLENQVKSMMTEYQTKIQAYQAEEAKMLESQKKDTAKEITDLEERIKEFQQSAQGDLQKKKEDLYSPILKKAEEAIKEVAKENGYTYILDIASGSVLYFTESNDISALVKKKLNITSVAPVKETLPGK